MNITQLKKDQAAEFDAANALLAKADTEKRSLTPEELTEFDQRMSSADGIAETIKRAEKMTAITNANADAEERAAGAQGRVSGNHSASVHNNAEDAPFAGIGDFCRAVINSELTRVIDPRLIQLRAATGLNETVGSDGGFLVQKDLSTTIRDRMYSVGNILARCNMTPISANSNGVKLPTVDETSRADGSQFGGVTCYWISEAGTIVPSKPKFASVDLELKKVVAATYVTDELMQDTTALGAWLMRRVPETLRWKVENSVFRGDGAGKPLGILSAPCLVSVTAESGQAADTVLYENITKMYARLWTNSVRNARWYINQDVYPQLFTMSLTVGTGGAPVWMPPSGQSPFGTLLGIPVEPVEYCSTVGDVGDIVLADFSQYELIDKGGIQNAVSIHVAFLTDEQVLRWTYRVDGQPGWKSDLTPANGTNDVSPFVALATR